MLMLSSAQHSEPCQRCADHGTISGALVLGLYVCTKGRVSTPLNIRSSEKAKSSTVLIEVIIAINEGKLSKHANIKCRLRVRNDDRTFETKLVGYSGGTYACSTGLFLRKLVISTSC